MHTTLLQYTENKLQPQNETSLANLAKSQLVLGFGGKDVICTQPVFEELKITFPNAHIVLCSTAGEIINNRVNDNSVSIAAIELEKTSIQPVMVNIRDFENSYEAGKALIRLINFTDLAYILVISDGSNVNGSELVRGINELVDDRVPVTGGLAGDGNNFKSTVVGLNKKPSCGNIVAIPFYGKHFIVSHASMGGWEIFGPERTVTKSVANQLFEIEGQKALDLYKTYLGPYAEELPGSALLFPLGVKVHEEDVPIVRTILSIDQETGSMVFAGDVPNGSKVRFMKANFDKLVDAATNAASKAFKKLPSAPQLALLISCVGRKIILGKRTEEEVEAVADTFGNQTLLTGFYSYGEISPFNDHAKCELHNQTMTITTFDEI
ncbi:MULTISPECIES: FIST signal transduction protein [Niastella]|uniref:FIST C-terminal domain-containing protein n=1 Tax=Niastella soli TaxID=2821487 RepID=A0ABS3YQV5_9BACT|nr:FIST N-terminal domain-containing protein [Niastella soli]MBO9199586.1 FIST C-terminal domain-containing protein [Niastella soli]